MKKIIDYLLSALFLLYFGILLVIFHGIQYIAFTVFGQKAHQKTVEWLNFGIVYGWLLTGSTAHFKQKSDLPSGQPILFLANHQSMFDIPGIIWFLRKYTPLFVSKIELAKGIPSISYNLRVGGAALIDRKDGKQAIKEIIRFGKYVVENNFSAMIFPEGTRSRTGELKTFAVGGVATLLKVMKNPVVVPIAIQDTAKFNPKGIFPLTSFTKMFWTTLEPIQTAGKTPEEVVSEVEMAIQNHIKLSR